MKRGLPNSLPLPNSCQKPRQFFLAMPMFLCLALWYALTHVAHAEFAWSVTQDGSRLELVGNAFKITGAADIDDLKKVASRFLSLKCDYLKKGLPCQQHVG